MNGVFLSLNSLSDSRVWGSRPCYKNKQSDISLVGKWRLPYHNVDDQDSNITQRTAARPQVGERFVSRCIDDKKTRNLVFLRSILKAVNVQPRLPPSPRQVWGYLVENSSLGLDSVHREVSGSDLLCNPTSFALLDVRLPDLEAKVRERSFGSKESSIVTTYLIQKLRLPGIDVPENTANGAP